MLLKYIACYCNGNNIIILTYVHVLYTTNTIKLHDMFIITPLKVKVTGQVT